MNGQWCDQGDKAERYGKGVARHRWFQFRRGHALCWASPLSAPAVRWQKAQGAALGNPRLGYNLGTAALGVLTVIAFAAVIVFTWSFRVARDR